MKRVRTFDEVADRISLYDLKAYLERTGWQRLPSKGQKWIIFQTKRQGSDQLELVIPADDRYTDTRERIREAVSSISQIEARKIDEVSSDLVAANADSLLIKLEVSDSAESIPVGDAPRHVKALRNLLLYSGCSEIQVQPHFEQPLPASVELLDGFQFCHTFRGSFGFEVSNAIASPQRTNELFEAPVRRRMIERIARGVLLLDVAVAEENPDVLIKAFPSALNARMCDALADIGLEGKVKFGLGIDWARALAPAEDVSQFSDRVIGEPQVNLLKHVSKQLKIVKPKQERITGQVVNLHCVADPTDGNARRTVAVKVEHSEHGTIEVKFSLGPEAYLMAIDAHSKGRKLLASGQLQRKGNTWSLDSIVSVEATAG